MDVVTTHPVRPLRILVVPAKPWPCDHAMLESVFAKILPGRGNRVEWVMWADRPAASSATWHGSTVHLTRYGAGSATAAAARWCRLIGRMVRVARRGGFDVLQVRNSTAAGLAALALRRASRSLFVFQVSFPVAEWTAQAARRGDVRVPTLRRGSASLQRALRRWLVLRADLVLAISDRMRDELVRDGVAPHRVLAFPLGTDLPPEPDRAAVAALRAELGVREEPLILYAGSISPQRELSFLVRVAELVTVRHPSARWLLLGPAASGEDERLRAEAARAGLAGRFEVRAAVPRSEVPAYLAVSSVTVSPIPPVPIYLLSSPSKTVESLAAGRPVVATAIPDQATVLDGSGGGSIVAYRPEAFADAIGDLLDDPERRASMGASGRAWVGRHRSYERLATVLEDAYLEALERRG